MYMVLDGGVFDRQYRFLTKDGGTMTDEIKDKYRGRCLTCEFWMGDRDRMEALATAHPECMELRKIWTDDGTCKEHPYELEIIRGDASVSVTFNANFGCVMWELCD